MSARLGVYLEMIEDLCRRAREEVDMVGLDDALTVREGPRTYPVPQPAGISGGSILEDIAPNPVSVAGGEGQIGSVTSTASPIAGLRIPKGSALEE